MTIVKPTLYVSLQALELSPNDLKSIAKIAEANWSSIVNVLKVCVKVMLFKRTKEMSKIFGGVRFSPPKKMIASMSPTTKLV